MWCYRNNGAGAVLVADDYEAQAGEAVFDHFPATVEELQAAWSDYVEPAGPPVITYPADVWRRCTNEEADTLYAAMDTQSAKLRGIWNTSQKINHADDLYSTLREFIKTALGSADYTRADELLAASE